MDELNLLLKYPLMLKHVEGGVVAYRGSINVDGEDYKISITELENNLFKPALPEELIPFEDQIQHSISLCERSIVSVLDTLCTVIASTLPPRKPIDHCDAYKHVLYEYTEFTKFYLNLKSCYLAKDLSKIDISMVDEWHREHIVEIGVNFVDNKNTFEIKTYDLPHDREVFKGSSSLKVVYDQFVAAVEALQPFFGLMEVLDQNCWVLDPVEPKRSCNYRRISLGENLSVIISIDPFNASRIPEIKFLGPERLVEGYRNRLNDHLENWDPAGGVFSEILKLFGMDSFPQKSATTENLHDVLKESGDCSICFSLRLNEKLPEIVCKNKACENYYHIECLYEWLVSVNARRFFTEVIGQCPNCEKTISCPVPR